MLYRFANFELDEQRAELRGAAGTAVKLRRKSFDLLTYLATNPGRVVSKNELTEAVWPEVHVGEDSLFQCIREVRTALGDDRRRLVKVVPGRGYLLDAAVSTAAAGAPATNGVRAEVPTAPPGASLPQRRFVPSRRTMLAAIVGVCTLVGLAVATPIVAPDFFKRPPQEVAVVPIATAGGDAGLTAMAADVTERVTDGLAGVANIRVVIPASQEQAGRNTPAFVVKAQLDRTGHSWVLRARLVIAATGEVRPLPEIDVAFADADRQRQQTRLAAGLGNALARQINALLHRTARSGSAAVSANAGGKAAIEQAVASINRTSPERFGDAQAMLEKAVARDPADIDVKIALAALKVRGIQMVWYDPAGTTAAEKSAKQMLEAALRVAPHYIPLLDGYCRFLTATNQFVDSLVACAQALSFDPWDGIALYHIGLAELQLGRFDDALDTFKQADKYGTPQVSRWTWLLGAGLASMLMGHDSEAVSWLQRSIAITAGSGRTHMLLAAAYQRLGCTAEARATMHTALTLRPGSTAANVSLPMKNTSPAYREAADGILRAAVAAGLPER